MGNSKQIDRRQKKINFDYTRCHMIILKNNLMMYLGQKTVCFYLIPFWFYNILFSTENRIFYLANINVFKTFPEINIWNHIGINFILYPLPCVNVDYFHVWTRYFLLIFLKKLFNFLNFRVSYSTYKLQKVFSWPLYFFKSVKKLYRHPASIFQLR